MALTGLLLVGASTFFIGVLAVRRLSLARKQRRQVAAEARLRDRALALLLEGAPAPVALSREDEEAFSGLVARLARHLRGDARLRAAAYFEQRGLVGAEVQALRSRRTARRAQAAYLLGEMDAHPAVPALRQALRDREREVRARAATALGKLGAEEAVADIAAALAARTIPRLAGATALLAIGDAALPELHRLARGIGPELRAAAVELIGLLGTRKDAGAVVERLRDTSAPVRARAAAALGRLGSEEAAEPLRQALGDRLPYVRAAAAEALGAIGDPAALPLLLPIAAEDVFEPARAAAVASVRLDPDESARAAARTQAPHLLQALAEAAL